MILTLNGMLSRKKAIQAVQEAPEGWQVRITQSTRNLEQNAKLWACLTDISNQVPWYGVKLSPDEWKAVFTAAQNRSKVVPGLDGGFVVLGQMTSRMTKAEFSELLELINAFAAEHDVKWSASDVPE